MSPASQVAMAPQGPAGGPSAGQGHASSTVAPTQAQLTKADEAQVMLDVFLRVMEADESEENEKFIDRMNKISGVVHGVQCAVKDMPYLQVVAPILGIASTLFKLFADTRANHGDARALIQEVELVTKGVYGRLYERVEAGYGVTNVDVVKGRLENLKKSLMNTEKTVEKFFKEPNFVKAIKSTGWARKFQACRDNLEDKYNFFCEELPWLPPSARRRRNVAAYQESMLADLKLTAKKGGVVDLEGLCVTLTPSQPLVVANAVKLTIANGTLEMCSCDAPHGYAISVENRGTSLIMEGVTLVTAGILCCDGGEALLTGTTIKGAPEFGVRCV